MDAAAIIGVAIATLSFLISLARSRLTLERFSNSFIFILSKYKSIAQVALLAPTFGRIADSLSTIIRLAHKTGIDDGDITDLTSLSEACYVIAKKMKTRYGE